MNLNLNLNLNLRNCMYSEYCKPVQKEMRRWNVIGSLTNAKAAKYDARTHA
jgi:hypothetical protein